MYKETKRLQRAWQPQGTRSAISPALKLASGAGDSSTLAKASETSRWLLQSNGSCNKPSPFLVYLDGWEEGSGERPLRREWVQGETVKASNIYWVLPCISRLHILFYLILTTNFITTIIMPILYIGGKNLSFTEL